MDALAKLHDLYELKKATDAQIEKIETLLGADPPKERKTRGPNKPKEPPVNTL